MGPPVMIRPASPAARHRVGTRPAGTSSTTLSSTGMRSRSALRTAYPSIMALRKGGWSSSEAIVSARTRPAASRRGILSVGSNTASRRIIARASSTGIILPPVSFILSPPSRHQDAGDGAVVVSYLDQLQAGLPAHHYLDLLRPARGKLQDQVATAPEETGARCEEGRIEPQRTSRESRSKAAWPAHLRRHREDWRQGTRGLLDPRPAPGVLPDPPGGNGSVHRLRGARHCRGPPPARRERDR